MNKIYKILNAIELKKKSGWIVISKDNESESYAHYYSFENIRYKDIKDLSEEDLQRYIALKPHVDKIEAVLEGTDLGYREFEDKNIFHIAAAILGKKSKKKVKNKRKSIFELMLPLRNSTRKIIFDGSILVILSLAVTIVAQKYSSIFSSMNLQNGAISACYQAMIYIISVAISLHIAGYINKGMEYALTDKLFETVHAIDGKKEYTVTAEDQIELNMIRNTVSKIDILIINVLVAVVQILTQI